MTQDDYNDATLMNSGVLVGTAGGSLGYGKGALVLAMLEQLIGTTNLVECMREWVSTHQKGEPAEWEEFESVVVRRMAQFQLQDFFDDWFKRPGFAFVTLEGGKFINGKFDGKLNWNGKRFRMPLELWFENKGGGMQMQTLDTKNVSEDGRFSIALGGFRPSKVYFDPYHRALRTGPVPKFESFADIAADFKVVRDPSHPEYLEESLSSSGDAHLENLDRKFLIGHPSTMPQLKILCEKAGFSVNGDVLTYLGTTINLKSAAAVAIIDLGEGKRCAIGLGTCRMQPNIGHAYIGIVDDLGRMLRGKTHFPATSGSGLPL